MSSVFHQRIKEKKPKRKLSKPERIAGQGGARFFSEAVGGIPQLAQLAQETTPVIQAQEELERPSYLSSTGLEAAPERGLRNLLALLGEQETVKQLTPERLMERFTESTGGQFEPQSALERIAQRPFQLGGQIQGLGGGLKAVLSQIPGGIVGQTLREAGAPESAASIAELIGPLAKPPKKGLQPSAEEKKIVDFAKQKGLTETEIAPLLKSKEAQTKLGAFALKTPALKKSVKNMGDKFTSNFYEPLKEKSETFGKLNDKQLNRFVDEMKKAQKELSYSKLPTVDKQQALDQIMELAEKVNTEGLKAREIIDTYQDINKNISWKKAGQKPFKIVNDALVETLKDIDPELAEEFALTNKLYSKYRPFKKALQPNVVDNILSLGNEGEIALALAFHNPSLIKHALGAVGGKYVANQLLTNPRYHNFSKKFQSAVIRNDLNAIARLNEQFKKMLEKDLPNSKEK